MRTFAVCSLVLCAACRFGVSGVPLDGTADLAVDTPDLALPAADDLAVVAGVDLASAGDPCGAARTPGPNVLAVRCVAGNPPVLDGDLSEWGTLDFTLTHRNGQYQSAGSTWTGPSMADDANCSASYSLRWDPSYLYVAVHVSDDIRGVHPTAAGYEPYLDDAVELYLDGLGDRTAAYNADDHQYVVTADGHSEEYQNMAAVAPLPPAFFAVKSDTVGAGYSVEYAVPWLVLGGTAPVNGRTLGVDFEIDDDDNVTMQELTRYLAWWNMMSPSCGYPSACTSTFGSAQLVGR